MKIQGQLSKQDLYQNKPNKIHSFPIKAKTGLPKMNENGPKIREIDEKMKKHAIKEELTSGQSITLLDLHSWMSDKEKEKKRKEK